MPVSFKRPKKITIVKRTPEDDLELCDDCGGINAMASTAVKVDCSACDSTGYSNFYMRYNRTAYYRPGSFKRWDAQAGGLTYVGDCSIKVDSSHADEINGASFIEMDGVAWKPSVIREPGEGFGQSRLVIALTRM